MKFERFLAGVAAVSVVAAAVPASSAVIASGGYSVGIGADGELYDAGAGVGFLRDGGYDPIAPGTPRDSWGINGAYADGAYFGSTVTSVVDAGASSAVVTTDTGVGFSVAQTYAFVGNILKIDTVVTNTTLDALSAIFQRVVDFDASFDDAVFGPVGPNNGVVDSSYWGFESPDTASPFALSCKFGCSSVSGDDVGVGIKINLGTLNAGASRAFTYYYGLNREGTDVNALIGDAQAAGAKYILATRAVVGGDSAIMGVSGVPEPAAWAMMLGGFFGLGAMVRRRRAVPA